MFTRLFYACLCFLAAAQSQADTTALQRLSDLLAGVDSYSARFQQTLQDAEGNVLQQLTGNLQVSRPGKLRWESAEPFPQLVVTDGDKLWIYDADLEQVTIKPFSGELSATPALLLSGQVGEIARSFHVSDINTEQFAGYELKPKDNSSLFSSLVVAVERGKVTALFMVDNLGQRTEIHFSQVSTSKPLDPSLFSFQPPAGTDILIDE